MSSLEGKKSESEEGQVETRGRTCAQPRTLGSSRLSPPNRLLTQHHNLKASKDRIHLSLSEAGRWTELLGASGLEPQQAVRGGLVKTPERISSPAEGFVVTAVLTFFREESKLRAG